MKNKLTYLIENEAVTSQLGFGVKQPVKTLLIGSNGYLSQVFPECDQNIVLTDLLHSKKGWYNFIERLKNCDQVIFQLDDSKSIMGQALPMLILSRFFGCRFILDYRKCDQYTKLDKPNRWLRKILNWSQAVILKSERTARVLSSDHINCICIADPIDLDHVQFIERSKVQPKIMVDITNFKLVNINCVFKAFGLVKQKYPRAEIVLCGSENKRSFLDSLISKHRLYGVEFSDKISAANITFGDVYLNCSFREYLPHSQLMAMAAGLPVVSSPVGEIDKFVNQENILLYNYNDFSKLADKLIELIESPQMIPALVKSARELMEFYSLANTRQIYQSYFESLKSSS